MIASTPAAWIVWPCVLAASVGLSALFSGMETGLYVLNKVRLDVRAEAGSRQAGRLRRLLKTPNNLLSVLLIGTNIANYAVAFSLTTMFALAGWGDGAEWYSMAAGTLLLFVLGETVPKTVFHRLAEKLTYSLGWTLSVADVLFKVVGLSYLLRAVSWLAMAPIRRRRGVVAEGRLGEIFAEGQASGVLTHPQAVIALLHPGTVATRVMNIGDVRLADVMVPLTRAIAIRQDTTRGVLMRMLRKHNYSRLPVRDETGDVVGILDVYEVLIDESVTVPAARMTVPLKLPAGMNVTEALYAMRGARNMMAVVQKDDKSVGIVTIKDLVEEIVGELEEW